MKDFINKLYQNHALIYKVILFLATTVFIVYLFPKGGQFKYNIQKGKPWQYENLYAPFDFAIQKSDEALKLEAEEIETNQQLFFVVNEEVKEIVKDNYSKKIPLILEDSSAIGINKKRINAFGQKFIESVYKVGFLNKADNSKVQKNKLISLRKGNELKDIISDQLFTTDNLVISIHNYFDNTRYQVLEDKFTTLFFEILEPNVFYDEELTNRALEEELKNRSFTKGLVSQYEIIISKGDLVEGEKYEILTSLKKEYDTQLWSEINYNWIVFGYTILVALVLLMLFLFLEKYRKSIYENNTKFHKSVVGFSLNTTILTLLSLLQKAEI